jgi:two-component system, cell cycle sensor histidine kinase and response regulator CckA
MNRPSDEQDELRRRVLGLDASGRKGHYASLRQRIVELERFRSVVDLSSDLLFVVESTSGRVVDVNETACQRLGAWHDELTTGTLASFLGEAARSELESLRADFEEGRRDRATLVTMLHGRGDGLPVEVAVRCVRAGDELHYVLAARDVTERQAAETAQRKLEEQLRQVQKMEAVGRLAGGVAHDFNNLLTVITGYGQMLLEDGIDRGVLRKYTETLLEAANQAASLTGQLLAFSRKQVLHPVALDLNTLVTDAHRMLRRVIPADIEVVTDLHPGVPAVLADAGQMHQVLLNLALNARDAMASGGRLTIATSPALAVSTAELPIRKGTLPGAARLVVSDAGAGIDAEMLGHIFEPFFTTKAPGKGTGLGLSTVYGIVTQSGGTVTVQSEVGKGTSFEILLPAAVEAARAEAAAGDRPAGGVETVLVAEDQPDVRRMAATVLGRLGYRVLEAANGAEALRVAESLAGPLHLLVSDIVMPGMNGHHLARRMRDARPGLRVLFISGYADRLLIERELGQHDAFFLQKPFTPGALGASVRAALDA